MAKRIAIFNHKGGVGKTTTTFHLGWMLAKQGKRVLMVDADSQCNLTGLFLGHEQFENFYESGNKQNIKDALSPAFRAAPKLIQPVECLERKEIKGLFLLPGHLRLSEYEVTLGVAQELASSIYTLQNIPGAFSYLFNETAEKYEVDYILIDMNPSLGAINQNLVMTSDYFLIPCAPDYFSIMALESMSIILPLWVEWSQKAQSIDILVGEDAIYPFPKIIPKFLGATIQRFNVHNNAPVKQYQNWRDKVNAFISDKFIRAVKGKSLLLNGHDYQSALFELPDFASLGSCVYKYNLPIFELDGKQLETSNLSDAINRRRNFESIFTNLATKVIQLTS